MSEYWPLIVGVIIIAAALFWWLNARKSVSKDSPQSRTIDAPPVAAAPAPKVEATVANEKMVVAPLMADPKPASKKAAPRPQAPLKAAATKRAPARTAVPKAVVAKPAAPKAATKHRVAVKPAAPKATPSPLAPDNLELLKGVGPKLNNLLKTLGVTSFAQIANWSEADIAEIDSKLGNFAGRISRDNWIDQATLLVSGDIAGFEKKYGALGSDGPKA